MRFLDTATGLLVRWLPAIAVLCAAVPARADGFRERVRPILVEYCFDCHDDDTQKGGVNLARFDTERSLHRDPRLWETALRQIEERSMPPRNKKQPGPAEYHGLVEGLRSLLENPDPSWLPRDPGSKIPHRLSRTEYNNTLRDLLGIKGRPADRFPPDGGGGGGFDNNADTLFVPPVLMEQYLAVADEALAEAPRENVIRRDPVPYSPDLWAARDNIRHFAIRAYRGRVTEADLATPLKLYRESRASGETFERAVRVACKAILVSPRFLFRVEASRPGKAAARLDAYELASRLSYFLWSSMPDEALLHSARTGRLLEEAELAAQVKRMLEDPRAAEFAENFTGQWLGTRTLAQTANPNLNRFPEYTVELREAMKGEPVAMMKAMIRENRSVLEFLDAGHVYVNETLAAYYGLEGVQGNEFQRVAVRDRRRGGILGMAAVLTKTSYPLRTSPVLRGKWILEDVLGTPPPPPPPLVATLPPDDKVRDGQSLRKRLEAHRTKENCAACHARLDPLGFALENFDPIGRWRDKIDGQPVDASGVLPGGEVVDGPSALKDALLRRKTLFARHLTEKMLAYALGRGLEYYDAPVVREIADATAADGYRLQTLILGIVRSLPFQYRRGADHEGS